MSRRKQANPAKLGESEAATAETKDDEDEEINKEDVKEEQCDYNDCAAMVGLFKTENDEDVEEDIDLDVKEEEKEELLEDDDDDDGSILNGQGSSPSSSSEQASPASSCQSSVSDGADNEDVFTLGATATTPYECNICKRAFARSSLLGKHVQTHTEQLQFSCPYCRRLFKHKRSRDRHTKLHTGDKKYKCLHCDSAFARSDHLKIHMKTHDNKKPHQCELCNRGYNTAAALASHQQHHSKQEQRRCGSSASRSSAVSTPSPCNYRCLQCPEIFEKAEHLQSHLLVQHKHASAPASQPNLVLVDPTFNLATIDLPKIACMYCGKDFYSMNQMYQHISEDHGAIFGDLPSPSTENMSPRHGRQNNSPTYACDKCTMRFDSPILLQEHLEAAHWGHPGMYFNAVPNATVPLDRPNANASQSKPTDLSRKRRPDCNSDRKIEKRKADSSLLLKTPPLPPGPYEDKPCICSYCYAQMPNFKMFLLHMESHVAMNAAVPVQPLPPLVTGNNPIGSCPLCGESVRSPTELTRHIHGHAISHVAGRCCHPCKKPFDQVDLLQKHLIDMHSRTIFKCTLCNELFDTQIALQMHFSAKHTPECKHYRCNLCPDQIFHDRLTAEIHVNMKHAVQVPLTATTAARNYMPRFAEAEPPPPQPRPDFPLYQCPLCQKTFKDEYLQYIHIMKEHHETREGGGYLDDANTMGRHVPSASPYNATVSPQENLKLELKLGSGYACEICSRTDITSEAELAAHKKLHHAKGKVGSVSLQCAYCNEHCKSRSDLDNHMKSHHISCGKGKHKCNICDEIFQSNTTLAEHKLSHCKIIAGNSCTQCKTILIDEQSFYNHQMHHSNAPAVGKVNTQLSLPANCIVCCQTLQTDVEIKLHGKFHLRHIMQKEYPCSICKNMFDGQHLTVKHIEKNNQHVPINVCNECFATANGGKYAPRSDSKRLYACLKCPQTFELEDEMKHHVSEHMANDDQNLECHLCRNILPSPSKLQIHLIEHNFMGIGQYRCYVCSSVFTTALGLRSHIVGHGLSQRPYECSECQMRFYFETELENHKFVHLQTQTKAYTKTECDIYDKSAPRQYPVCKICLAALPDAAHYNEHAKTCRPRVKNEEGTETATATAVAVEVKQEEPEPAKESGAKLENRNEPQ